MEKNPPKWGKLSYISLLKAEIQNQKDIGNTVGMLWLKLVLIEKKLKTTVKPKTN